MKIKFKFFCSNGDMHAPNKTEFICNFKNKFKKVSNEHLNSDAKENSTIFVSSELDIQIDIQIE